MKPSILLVNPPIYDFSAYDFWLKPYGMLRVAGMLRGRARFELFDFLDRLEARIPAGRYRADAYGRGAYYMESGFKNLYLGFESSAYDWQRKTGGKVNAREFGQAVRRLVEAGFDRRCLNAYIIVGHPNSAEQQVHESIIIAHESGLRVILSEFSPIPGTPDGESCRRWVDLDEPLAHNKTAFAQRILGTTELNRIKQMAKDLNRRLGVAPRAGAARRADLELSPWPVV